MNKTELVAAVAEKAEISKKDADSAVNAVIESIIEAVASKDKVQIVGFGTFEARERKEKIGKKPKNRRRNQNRSFCSTCIQSW